MFKVEYLITVDQREPFCKTVAAFNNLVKTIDGVSLSKSEIKFGDLSMHYEVQIGEIQSDKQRFFHLKLSLPDESGLQEFEAFLRNVRGVLQKAGGKPPHVLWDGVSFNLAQRAYPIVHEIENTMRKLITKFMLINVGVGWAKEAVPKEVMESVRSKDAKLDQNYLYEVDFIQLSNFLFKEYATINPGALIERLRKAETIGELKLEELKLAIPRSNWDRFFSKVVNCESEYLRIRWERLYERRNQIAHNRPVSRSDFDEICKLRDELAPKLVQAIESLDRVTVSEDERELVSENAATSKGVGYGEFLAAWNDFHFHLFMLASLVVETSEEEEYVQQQKNNIRTLLNIVTKQYKVLTNEQRSGVQDLLRLRNYMVHQPDIIVPAEALSTRLASVLAYNNVLRERISQVINNNGQLPHSLETYLEKDGDVPDESEATDPVG